MDKKRGGIMRLTALCVFLFCFSVHPYSAKVLRYTTDGTSGGTSVEPGFGFNAIWTGLGMGKNKCVYVAVCDQRQSQPSYGTIGKGNVCVVKYNPYTNQMRSCGTVKKACQSVNNWMSNESSDKIHTHLMSMPDGKVWMANHDNDGAVPGDPTWYAGLFYRGSHLMYVDVFNGDTLVDHTPSMQYYFKKDAVIPSLVKKGIPASDTSGVVFQFHSIMILGINPWAPRYIWMESLPGAQNTPKIVVYDVMADTMRTVGFGDGNQREMVVDRQGRAWYVNSGSATRKTPHGQSATRGTGLTLGHSTTYSRTFDSAFTITGSSGELNLYDFVRDTVIQIAKLPTGSNNYRTLVTSRDGKKLYTIATGSGAVYEINLATRAYANIFSVSSQLSGYWYATGNMCADTLGNIYSGLHNGNAGQAALLQVNLGKDLVWPLDIPDATEVEKMAAVADMQGEMRVSPNPFRGSTRITVRLKSAVNDLRLSVYDASGRLVKDIVRAGKASTAPFQVGFEARDLPTGVYFVKLVSGNRVTVRKAMLMR